MSLHSFVENDLLRRISSAAHAAIGLGLVGRILARLLRFTFDTAMAAGFSFVMVTAGFGPAAMPA